MPVNRIVFSFLIVLIVSAQVHAVTFNLGGSIRESPRLSGEPTYNLFMTLTRLPLEANTGHDFKIVDPLGVKHQGFADATFKATVNIMDIPAADLGSYGGDWAIEETLTDGMVNEYQLVLPDMSQAPWFQGDSPRIVSPESFSTVGPQFELEWINTSPTDCNFSSFGLPESIDCHSPGAATFTYVPEDEAFNRPFEIAVYSFDQRSDFFEVSPTSLGSTTIQPMPFAITRESSSIVLTVVPEPYGSTLAWAGLFGMLVVIRRFRRRAGE